MLLIAINHTLTEEKLMGERKILPTDRTKNQSSCRTLPLSENVKERLLFKRAQQEENKKLCGNCYNREWLDYIFVNEIGEIIAPGYVESAFPKLLKKCGLEHHRFHDLCHSCASLLLASGVPMKMIQDRLGHSDMGTTRAFIRMLTAKARRQVGGRWEMDKKEPKSIWISTLLSIIF